MLHEPVCLACPAASASRALLSRFLQSYLGKQGAPPDESVRRDAEAAGHADGRLRAADLLRDEKSLSANRAWTGAAGLNRARGMHKRHVRIARIGRLDRLWRSLECTEDCMHGRTH